MRWSRVIGALEASACALGLDHASRRIHRGALLIVCYHGVTEGPLPEGCPEWHHVDVRDFERQIGYLDRNYALLPIDDAIAALHAGSARRLACITFDDGYRNNLDIALPVLRRVGVPATIYLTTGLIGTDRVLWTVQLEAAIRRTSRAEVDPGRLGPAAVRLGDDRQRRRLAHQFIDRLKHESAPTRDTILRDLFDCLGLPSAGVLDPFTMLDWDDVGRLENSSLITFGAHTVNHEILSRLDDAGVEHEIGESVATVSRRVRSVSNTFAYPNGRHQDFDHRAGIALVSAGVRAALTTIEGLNTPRTDIFQLRRVLVARNTNFSAFRVSTSDLIPRARR